MFFRLLFVLDCRAIARETRFKRSGRRAPRPEFENGKQLVQQYDAGRSVLRRSGDHQGGRSRQRAGELPEAADDAGPVQRGELSEEAEVPAAAADVARPEHAEAQLARAGAVLPDAAGDPRPHEYAHAVAVP